MGEGRTAVPILTSPPRPPPPEYAAQLERQLQFYTEAARRLGSDGSRVSRAASRGRWGGWGCPPLPADHLLAPRRLRRRHSTGGTW